LSTTKAILPLLRDIGNIASRARIQELNSQIPIKALLEVSQKSGWLSKTRVDQSNYLESIFMISTSLLAYFKANSEVLIMDCTYKTNRFGLLLLHIISKLELLLVKCY
jgi:hypothetical protein